MNMIPCECEWKCGTLIPEFDNQGRKRRFVNGHQCRGKSKSEEARRNMSINHANVSGENNPMYGKTLSPEARQLISDSKKGKIPWNKGIPRSEETKQKIRINHIDNSGEKAPMFGKHHSPETKQLMSKFWIGKRSGKENPMYGKRAENSPVWKGGISKLPYCPIWTPWLKEEIKERDNHQCQNPDCLKTSKRLACHHIDYDKKNCSVDNLITLCNSCNSRANHNREHWQEFYTSIIKNNINNRGLKK